MISLIILRRECFMLAFHPVRAMKHFILLPRHYATPNTIAQSTPARNNNPEVQTTVRKRITTPLIPALLPGGEGLDRMSFFPSPTGRGLG
jgi:hypothetical protein